ncbi:MAG: sigma-70 factor domain-containing protein, partial [Burkholderiales bacterium]
MMRSSQTLPMALPLPMAAGSLEAYIQSVKRFPLLSAEQERDYARRYQRDGDLDAARQLVLSHLRLVVAVARGYLG